jgi:CheY-like chemotaxis protein
VSGENGQRRTVLVVEDEVLVQMLVLEVLSDLDLDTLEADDAASALAHIRSDARIDLMVTDVGLPGMNGRDLADAAREIRPGLRVLFVTGYADRAQAGEFVGEGMDMIVKPFALDQLSDKISEMVAG